MKALPNQTATSLLLRAFLPLVVLLIAPVAIGAAPTADELATTRKWAAGSLSPKRASAPGLPFSFRYDGQSSTELLPGWASKQTAHDLDRNRTQRTLTWLDPKTGLQVRCVAILYRDFPVVEWTLHFKNTGTNPTPILADIKSLDLHLRRHSGAEFVLHHHTGDNCSADSYQPHQTLLGTNMTKRFAPAGGRPTTGAYPYFNLEYDGGGAIAVIGWPGQWAAEFARDERVSLRVLGGQELTRFKLLPGEEVRSPLSVVLFWKGDWTRSQNLWRRWMVVHNLPRPGGSVVPTHYAGCFGNAQPRAAEEIAQISGWIKEGIKLDYWFIDAGWYPGRGTWSNVGTWEVDATRFPRGLREVADHCHTNGIQFIAWFEPERVTAGSWLAEHHPEWVLGGKAGGLLNLGNANAWQWTLERVDSLLTSQGIDVYRQDFNIEPLPHWRANDSPDRQGITEIKHVTAYLALWDELLRRHPAMYIDTCASGGRRNDLETLRRSVPLLRSDYPITDFTAGCSSGQQAQTYGLSLWVPYHGTGAPFSDPYTMRSCYAPAFRLGWDTQNQNIDHALLRKTVADFRAVQKLLLEDYYPLTPYSLADDAWIAWQFDSPETGRGAVQAFRRNKSANETAFLKLGGLEPTARYRVTDLDASAPREMTGAELKKKGLLVRLTQPRSSAILVYQRLK